MALCGAIGCLGPVEPQPARPYPYPGHQRSPSSEKLSPDPNPVQAAAPQTASKPTTGEPTKPPPVAPVRKLTPLEEAAAANDRGKEALWAGKTDEAIAHFEDAYRLDPMDPRFTRNLAIAYDTAERYADAIVFARRLMKMAAADRKMMIIGAVRSGDALWDCLAKKMLNCSNEPVLTSAEVERLDKQGQELVSAKRTDDALLIFLRAYAYSGDARPLLRIATFEYVTGFYTDAREHASQIRRYLGDQPSKLRDDADVLIKAIEVECKKQPDECKSF